MKTLKNITLLAALVLTMTFYTACNSSDSSDVPSYLKTSYEDALSRSGDNKAELLKAMNGVEGEEKEGMAFLIAYMPQCDLDTLKAPLLINNVKYAYKAKNEFPWCKTMPDSIFLNEVLPYMNLSERREDWRGAYYDLFKPKVEGITNIRDAFWAVNTDLNKTVDVEYNIKRKRNDQGPFESMEQHMATCTGLSIILVDALRAVGIPARTAGTPMWTKMNGNHTWVEVLIDGVWYFTEFYPEKELDHGWFLANAGQADPTKPIHCIYAASYKPQDKYFILEWDRDGKQVYGVDRTQHYIDVYQKQLEEKGAKEGQGIIDVVLYSAKATDGSDLRVSEQVSLWSEGKKLTWGYSPTTRDDLNKFLKFKLEQGKQYTLKYKSGDGTFEQPIKINSKHEKVELYLK